MNRITRILKHRFLWDETDTRRHLDAAALQRLQDRIAASEARHSGEIRLCVEASLPLSYLWRDATPRQRALTLFGKLGVWDTDANNGVLIYLMLAEHAIEIVADRGLNPYIDAAAWQALVAHMADDFRAGRFEAGLVRTIDAVDAVLARHFPLAAGQANPNELPDTPVLN